MIAELLEQGVQVARDIKTATVKRGEPVATATLANFRGDVEVAIVMPNNGARPEVLRAAHMCIGGFEADILVLAMDTYHTELTVNPRTGAEWKNGEMGEVADLYEGRENGWVSDAMAVLAVNRAGDLASSMLPYRMVGRRRIEWADPYSAEDLVTFGGIMADALVEYMQEPPMSVRLRKLGLEALRDFGLDPERAQAHSDIAVAKLLTTDCDCTVALRAKAGTVRQQVIKDASFTVEI